MSEFEQAVKNVKVGDPMDESTEVGPLVTLAHRESVASFINEDTPVAFRGSLEPREARRDEPARTSEWYAIRDSNPEPTD